MDFLLDAQLSKQLVARLVNSGHHASRGLLLKTLVWLRLPDLANDLLWLRLERALPAIESAAHANKRIVEVL